VPRSVALFVVGNPPKPQRLVITQSELGVLARTKSHLAEWEASLAARLKQGAKVESRPLKYVGPARLASRGVTVLPRTSIQSKSALGNEGPAGPI